VQGLQEQAPAISLVLLPVQSVVYGWWWFLARDVVWRVDRAPISA
jgi:hypothetical protein